jgi:membrane-associated protein
MDLILRFVDVVLHLDTHLNAWAAAFGPWLYVILFAIIFAETGLVVTPFLPGDSLLFAVGALCAIEGSVLNVWVMMVVLVTAAVIGDAVNYAIGQRVGPRVFKSETSRFLNKKHLLRAQKFYEKHGGKTIIIARFVPIIRTYAPFVAGIGQMGYRRFFSFNVIGAVAWVVGFLLAGHVFGNLPIVKKQFHFVIVAIIILSILPAVWEFWQERKAAKETETAV